ncbi:hypothetical protein [Paenibacillus sacheonensis]|uniref:Uncharacterized protein n=1 Tax=Paenibacillus sacheonensis TaxID=742054 RepID=A0A7X4YQG2_9BACL|nr:hypothetical protein [Paenibacillus sacheonensis]MBM7566666.1 hypothetical protein [Paenibacillus sacheonensis]NBC70648.1 hypothetical protein [Paenibacillus sacheonensis]
MLNHYEHQKLAEMKEDAIRKRADEQWMHEPAIEAGAISRPKGILKRIQAVLTALFA